jgi:hypothetical protein
MPLCTKHMRIMHWSALQGATVEFWELLAGDTICSKEEESRFGLEECARHHLLPMHLESIGDAHEEENDTLTRIHTDTERHLMRVVGQHFQQGDDIPALDV